MAQGDIQGSCCNKNPECHLCCPLPLTVPGTQTTIHDMNTTKSHWIPPELMTELHEAVKNAAQGAHEPEAMKKACERMDRLREEIYRKHGLLDIGVPAIRELRDGE